MYIKAVGAAIAVIAPLLSLTACQSGGPLGCSSWKSHLSSLNHDAAVMKASAPFSTTAMRAAALMERDAEDAASCPPPGSIAFDNLWSDTMSDYSSAASAYLSKDYSNYVYYYDKGRAGLKKIYADKRF